MTDAATPTWRCDCPPGSDPEACFCMYRSKADGGLCEPDSEAALIAKLRAWIEDYRPAAQRRGYEAPLRSLSALLDEHEKGAEPMSDERDTAIRLRACEIMEQRTGMPSYLADDETADAAYAQAAAEYVPPAPLSPLQEAVRKASGRNPTADEIAASIGFINRVSGAMHKSESPSEGPSS